MTLDWPLAFVVVAALICAVFALRAVLPYVVGQSTEKARAQALEAMNKRLNDIEAHLASSVRRMPGRLG